MRIVPGTAALAALFLSVGAAAASFDFGTVVDNLDRRKVTKMHAQEYCKSVRGQEVSWSGDVYDVKGGRNRAKIFVAERSRPVFQGYNIVVLTSEMDRAAAVKKGQRIHFKGQIRGCTLKDNGAIIQVDDASLR